MSKISLLDYANTAHGAYDVNPEKMLGGSPRQILSNHYTSPGAEFHVGFWEAEVGKWQVNYTEFEYCEILQGVIQMTDSAGLQQTVRLYNGSVYQSIDTSPDSVFSLVELDDGRLAGATPSGVQVWDTNTMSCMSIPHKSDDVLKLQVVHSRLFVTPPLTAME